MSDDGTIPHKRLSDQFHQDKGSRHRQHDPARSPPDPLGNTVNEPGATGLSEMGDDRITEAEIDAGGKALREHDMAGRLTRKWEELPNSDAQKWRLKAKLVLAAAKATGTAGERP